MCLFSCIHIVLLYFSSFFYYSIFSFFFFNATATTEIYTLSLHDALPIFERKSRRWRGMGWSLASHDERNPLTSRRSEEHTSELQSRGHLVCRLLLEKKKKNKSNITQ